ncbi:hypothetical protein [Nocardia sp. NRRL S-836]|uniref:hypothetical protein n=1 Tax=Nocardia sp. NRRL S-836 TaxID=1519492 RepID=UPI0006AD9C9C|nr:hypothetical protein [Nocardia sp. NRRL S-836]KOV84714.1 hypothetical protein ADL03_15700 [Nocardia sp. NRRL S-836]
MTTLVAATLAGGVARCRAGASGAALRALLDSAAAEGPAVQQRFLRHRQTGTVHVRWPADPRAAVEVLAWSELGEVLAAPVATLCGYAARHNRDGRGDAAVPVFVDEDLCGNCHREQGPHTVLAFEHSTPLPHEVEEARS